LIFFAISFYFSSRSAQTPTQAGEQVQSRCVEIQAFSLKWNWCRKSHQFHHHPSLSVFLTTFGVNHITPIPSKAGRKQAGDISENDEGGAAARKFSTGCSTTSGGI
jgi:hypothetical protein